MKPEVAATPSRRPAQPRNRRAAPDWAKWMVGGILLMYYGAAAPRYITGHSDSAVYVGLARSLASGQGYAFNFEPHTKYPPGYPLMLAGVMLVAGENYPWLNLIATVAAAAAFLALWALARRQSGSEVLAAGTAILWASSCAVFVYASKTQSDMPYVPLMLLALWFGSKVPNV